MKVVRNKICCCMHTKAPRRPVLVLLAARMGCWELLTSANDISECVYV